MSTALSCYNPRVPQPLRWAAWVGLLVFGLARAEAAEPFFFIQLSDPQFGMSAANADVQQETANFEFAIATANRLKPAFVVVTGDLVNTAGDKTQVDEYLRIAAKLEDGTLTEREVREIAEMRLRPLPDIQDVQVVYENHLYGKRG